MTSNEIIFLLIAFLGSIVAGSIGFGIAIIVVPLSSLVLPIKKAAVIVNIAFAAMNLSNLIIFRKHANWKLILIISLGAIPATILGSTLLVYAPTRLLEILLGLIAILYIINDHFNFLKNIKLNNYGIAGGGALYGFFSGIIGTGDIIKAIFLTHIGLRKENFIATMAGSAIINNIVKAIVYTKFALMTKTDIPLIIALVVCAILGVSIGQRFVHKVSSETFKKMVIAVLFVASIKLLFFP